MRAVRLSIVTPTRDAPHLMDRLYNSLFRQTCPDFEHVLVDTSVDDRIHDRWCRDFSPHLDHRFRYARVHLYRPEIASAYEYAFGQAIGEYVCPMTHKAMWRPDAVENLHRILDRFPKIHSFAFRSLYIPNEIHAHRGDFREMADLTFGSSWDGADPVVHGSRDLFLYLTKLFEDHGYFGPWGSECLRAPFSSHAMFSRALLGRVRDRFGTIVAGHFAADSRLGWRILDLEGEVYQFPDFEPRLSSLHADTGAAGSQLQSWRYLRKVFQTMSAETQQIISRSPFGYLPLWSVQFCWEIFSVTGEAQDHLKLPFTFDARRMIGHVANEIRRLTDIDEPARAGLLRQTEAIAARCEDGVMRRWF